MMVSGFSFGRLKSLSAWTSDNESVQKEGTASSQLKKVTDHDINKIFAPKNHPQLKLVLYTQQMVGQLVPASLSSH